jgi:ABC-2 type transport system permease protein
VRSLTGTGRLVRLALRRDRVVGPVWIVAIAGLMWATAASIVGLYQSVEERVAAATFAANNVILRIFDGPPTGTELGSLVLQEGYWLIAVLSALACSQAVVRHTRTEEESGRAELIGAAVVGRHARLAAGIIAASVVGVGVGVGVALVLVTVGLPAEGSTLTGATLTGVGLVFAGVAAVAAQVGASARAANASAGGVLGAAWLLRAVGDAAGTVDDSGVAVVSAWPTWLSPIGWGQQAQPFSTGRWWVLALLTGVAVLLMVAAHALSVHRDVGAGMFAGRPGRSEASRWLRSPLGLAWRLHASTVVVWAVALAIVSAAFGGMGDSVDDLAGLSDEVRAMLEAIAPGGTLVDMFFAFTAGFVAIAASAFAVQVLLRIRSEELGGRAEHVLAARVSRHRHLASHGVVAAGGVVAIMVVASVSGGIAYGIVTGDWATGLQGQVRAALAMLPAALVLAAFVLLAVAVVPRAAVAIGWGALAASFVLGQLGAILDLPQVVLNLSPFTHVPAVPAQPVEATPMVALAGTAIVLTAAAFVAHRRRDLVTAA